MDYNALSKMISGKSLDEIAVIKCLETILKDFQKTGICQGNYSDGEHTQNYQTRMEMVEECLERLK